MHVHCRNSSLLLGSGAWMLSISISLTAGEESGTMKLLEEMKGLYVDVYKCKCSI